VKAATWIVTIPDRLMSDLDLYFEVTDESEAGMGHVRVWIVDP